jgi:glycosyltransferase involved in cell wall biosynthesis
MRTVGRKNARLLRSAPFVVTLTPSHTKVLSSLVSRVQEIRNPIDCKPVVRHPLMDNVVTIGYVGRLSYEKGPDVLVEALARVDGSVGPIRVLVAGSGPLEQGVRRRADALGVPGMEFLGWVDDPHSVLERLDVLVLPSRAEAVPLVLVEALGAGCLVVSTDAGSGVRDLLDRGRLGAVVPTEDPGALASAIERAVCDVRTGLAPDPADVATLVESHSPDVVLRRWVCFLERQAAAGKVC